MEDWVNYALYAHEVKEDTLLKSINEWEKALHEDVDRAFRQVIRANATITAHLNSIRRVQEVQDEILKALNIKDLRDRINNTLIKASEEAATGLKEIQQLDEKAKDLTEQVKSLSEKGNK